MSQVAPLARRVLMSQRRLASFASFARVASLAAALGAGLALHASPARADDAYALDEISREIPARGAVRCPAMPLTDYAGSAVRFHAPARVHPAFVAKLRGLEEAARAVAIEVYGRPPARMHHLGTYNCRRIPGYPHLVSEHGLGNAIDVDAFSFGPLPAGAALPAGAPRALRGAFDVSVAAHFGAARGPLGPLHRRFLHRLALRLARDTSLFRVVLGPGYPGHGDHFHLDMASYRLVVVDASAEAAR